MNLKSTLKVLALAAVVAVPAQASAADVAMGKAITAFYEKVTSDVANYYLAVSDNQSATYSSSTGVVTMKGGGYMLCLDLYGTVADTKPIRIPEGSYKAGDGTNAFTYYADPEVSYLMEYNDFGSAVASYPVSGPVTVSSDNSVYTITATATVKGETYNVNFTGEIGFDDTEETPYVWPQLRRDIECTFTDAMAVYDGNLFQSNTGEFYLNLGDGELNKENGMIVAPNTTRVAIMLFDVLFKDATEAHVMPGTYTMANNFRRKTWYPGMEMDYMGMTFPFGTYVQKHCPGEFAESDFGYSYVSDGTVEIERGDDGIYDITVDCVTTYGHSIKGTFHGAIPVVDQSAGNSGPSSISTLEHDVVCDLDQIETARVFYNNRGGNPTECHRLILDIGSPSGRDQALVDNGGDIIRFEMLQSLDKPYLVEGTYTVTAEKWENYYAPFGLVQGYFSKSATGDLTGTRYMHFVEGRYLVMDHLAPVVEGTLGVTKNADDTWTFRFSLLDDANFLIEGEWTGPVTYCYDPKEIMASTVSVGADSAEPRLERVDEATLRVAGVADGTAVRVYNSAGVMVAAAAADGTVSVSSLPAGIYVVSAAGHSLKFIK